MEVSTILRGPPDASVKKTEKKEVAKKITGGSLSHARCGGRFSRLLRPREGMLGGGQKTIHMLHARRASWREGNGRSMYNHPNETGKIISFNIERKGGCMIDYTPTFSGSAFFFRFALSTKKAAQHARRQNTHLRLSSFQPTSRPFSVS